MGHVQTPTRVLVLDIIRFYTPPFSSVMLQGRKIRRGGGMKIFHPPESIKKILCHLIEKILDKPLTGMYKIINLVRLSIMM